MFYKIKSNPQSHRHGDRLLGKNVPNQLANGYWLSLVKLVAKKKKPPRETCVK